MEIVIKIPNEEYEFCKRQWDTECLDTLMIAVKYGVPLPKGHGRLIDADELEECIELMNTINGETKYAVRWDDIRNMATIIEADKGDKNNDS